MVSATQITATFTIAAAATTGARNVTVTTCAGATGAVVFTVNAFVPPTETNVAPSSTVTVSSETSDYGQLGIRAIDGVKDGFPRRLYERVGHARTSRRLLDSIAMGLAGHGFPHRAV